MKKTTTKKQKIEIFFIDFLKLDSENQKKLNKKIIEKY